MDSHGDAAIQAIVHEAPKHEWDAFTTETKGISDLKLGALYVPHQWDNQQIHLNMGVSLPTGSVEERGDTPAGPNQQLPYPMQLGSGTYDLYPGLTYLNQTHDWSWGAQISGPLRLGENSEGYTLGNQARLNAWATKRWTDATSVSLRLDGHIWGNIDGRDSELNPMMVPTADPDRRGGKRMDLLLGFDFHGRSGWVNGHRFAIEIGKPIYQSLDGPQLETDVTMTFGWQYAF